MKNKVVRIHLSESNPNTKTYLFMITRENGQMGMYNVPKESISLDILTELQDRHPYMRVRVFPAMYLSITWGLDYPKPEPKMTKERYDVIEAVPANVVYQATLPLIELVHKARAQALSFCPTEFLQDILDDIESLHTGVFNLEM